MDLGQMLDDMIKYTEVLNHHGFKENGTGNLPWSHRFECEDGNYVERNASKWVLCDSQDALIDEGRNQDDLAISLKMIYG